MIQEVRWLQGKKHGRRAGSRPGNGPHSRHIRASQVVVYVLLVVGALVVAYPFFYMLMNSVKPGPEILHAPNSLPSHITWTGYQGCSSRSIWPAFIQLADPGRLNHDPRTRC